MRRHRRPSIGAISDTWNYSLRSADESLGYTHQFTDAMNEAIMEEDRLEQEKARREADQPLDHPGTVPPTEEKL